MRLKIIQIVGQPGEMVWSQVVVMSTSVREVELTHDSMLLVLALTLRTREADQRGPELIHQIEAKLGAEELGGKVERLLDRLEELMVEGLEVVGLYLGMKRVVAFGIKGGRVLLRRGERIGTLLGGVVEGMQIKEGRSRPGDRWLLGTKDLVGEMSQDLIEEVMGDGELTGVGESLTTQVQSGGDSAGVAGLVIDVEESEEVENGEIREEVSRERRAPKIYLRKGSKKQRMAVLTGVVLLILLGVSLVVGWRRRVWLQKEALFEDITTQVEELGSRAVEVQGMDRGEAKSLVIQARGLVNEAMGEFEGEEKFVEQLEVKKQELDQLLAMVSGEESLDEVQVWYELQLLREGMFGSQLVMEEGKVYVLDGNLGVVGEIDLESKKAALVGGGDLLWAGKEIDVSGERAVVYGEKGVTEVMVRTKTTGNLVEADDEWGRVERVGWFGGNVYLLDVGKSEVWRYPGLDRGVGSRQRWFGAGVIPDLSRATDMAIDGKIWILLKDGEILRFDRGAEENFTVTGLEQSPEEAVAIALGKDSERVYILDRGGKSIVVVGANGVYQRQYLWEGLSAAEDLAVDEESGQLLVLVGGSIYRIELK